MFHFSVVRSSSVEAELLWCLELAASWVGWNLTMSIPWVYVAVNRQAVGLVSEKINPFYFAIFELAHINILWMSFFEGQICTTCTLCHFVKSRVKYILRVFVYLENLVCLPPCSVFAAYLPWAPSYRSSVAFNFDSATASVRSMLLLRVVWIYSPSVMTVSYSCRWFKAQHSPIRLQLRKSF